MDDYGTQENYESNSYNYNDSNDQHNYQYEIDKSHDYSFSKGNEHSEQSDLSTVDIKTHSLDNNTDLLPEQENATPQSETENYKWFENENVHLENSNTEQDQYQSIITKDFATNENNLNNRSDYEEDNDCCSCKTGPLMCLAICCDCFFL